MCVKLPPRDLNLVPCLPHSTSTYTCGVTVTPRVCGGNMHSFLSIKIIPKITMHVNFYVLFN